MLNIITTVHFMQCYWKLKHSIWKLLSSTKPMAVHMQIYNVAKLSENVDHRSASLLIPNLYKRYLTEMEKARYTTTQTCRNARICFKSKHTCNATRDLVHFSAFSQHQSFYAYLFCLFVLWISQFCLLVCDCTKASKLRGRMLLKHVLYIGLNLDYNTFFLSKIIKQLSFSYYILKGCNIHRAA